MSRKRHREPSLSVSDDQELEDSDDGALGQLGGPGWKESSSEKDDGSDNQELEDSDDGEFGQLAGPGYQEPSSEQDEGSDDSLDALMNELDEKEKSLQKREHALKRGKGDMRRLAEQDGLESIPVSQGGLLPDREADVPEDHEDSDSEAAEARTNFDKELEERLLQLNEQERQKAEEIEEFERSLLEDKHWSLKGEVTAKMRPADSLLEMNMELPTFAQPRVFDYEDHLAAQEDDGDEPEPEEDKLEKEINLIIRRRIMNTLFDDVELKDVDDVLSGDKNKDEKEVLNFQKSKMGLADIYGQEFKEKVLRLPTDVKTEDDQRKVRIADMVSELLTTLDNLSNAHFNTRARYAKKGFNLTQEEAIPLNLKMGGTKAPEQVAAPEFEVTEKKDMTKDERRALRRAQKQRRKKLKTN